MDLETILNDCLNKAICQNGVKHKDSNSIAEFVTNYLREGINVETSNYVAVCFKCGKQTEYDGEGNWCFDCNKYTPF